MVQSIEPSSQCWVFVEDAPELGGRGGDSIFGIVLQTKLRSAAGFRFRARLHFPVDDQEVIAAAVGEQRCAERESVDLACDSNLSAGSPQLRGVEGDLDHRPVE